MLRIRSSGCCTKRIAPVRDGGLGGSGPTPAALQQTADHYRQEAQKAADFAAAQFGPQIQAEMGQSLIDLQKQMFSGAGAIAQEGRKLAAQAALWADSNAGGAVTELQAKYPQAARYLEASQVLAAAVVQAGGVENLIRQTAEIGVQQGARWAGQQVTAAFAQTMGPATAGLLGGVVTVGIGALFTEMLSPIPDFTEVCLWSAGGDPFRWPCRKRIVGTIGSILDPLHTSGPYIVGSRGAGKADDFFKQGLSRVEGSPIWSAVEGVRRWPAGPLLPKWPGYANVYCKSNACLDQRLRYLALWRTYWANSPQGIRWLFQDIQRNDEARGGGFQAACLPEHGREPTSSECMALLGQQQFGTPQKAPFFFYSMMAWEYMVGRVMQAHGWKPSDQVGVGGLVAPDRRWELEVGRIGTDAKAFPAPKMAAEILGLRYLNKEDLQDEWDQFYSGSRGLLPGDQYGIQAAWLGFWSGTRVRLSSPPGGYGAWVKAKIGRRPDGVLDWKPYVPAWVHAGNAIAARAAAFEASAVATRAAAEAYGSDSPEARDEKKKEEDTARKASGGGGVPAWVIPATGIGAAAMLGLAILAAGRRR